MVIKNSVKGPCFKDFLAWYRRSGGALVAESDVLKQIETDFGKIYVPHIADLEILSTIHKNISEEAFIMEIIGVPGVGKTKLLRELVNGLNPEEFEPKYRDLIEEIVKKCEFLDVENLEHVSKRTPVTKSGKKKVWVTLNIDEFLNITQGENPLRELYEKLNTGLFKGESLIICGNIGVLENDKAREAIENIRALMSLRNSKEIKLVRFPLYESLYWTKEYGVNIKKIYGVVADPSFLVSGREGFQEYSSKLIALGYSILKRCLSIRTMQPNCEKCIGPIYLNYIWKLGEMLKDEDFVDRLHDLLQFMWLKYTDIYLVARTLNIFWGYSLTEMWKLIEKKGADSSGKADKSLIYKSIYSSKLPSIYSVKEYNLSDTNIHRLRDTSLEQSFLHPYGPLTSDPEFRLHMRLNYFFEKLGKSDYRGKIYSGTFEEYMEEAKLATCITDISKRLVLLRLDKSLLYISENDERYKELFREPWGFEQLMFASKVTGIRYKNGRKIKVPLMISHESVCNEVGIESGVAFEEIQSPSHYLTNREKVLRLKLKLGKDVSKDLQERAPSLRVSLPDYIALRKMARGIGRPDISLNKTTLVKVISFLNAVEGFVTHEIRPIIWKFLKKDINHGESSRILVRTLGPDTQRCSLKIKDNEVTVEKQDGIELFRCTKEVFL